MTNENETGLTIVNTGALMPVMDIAQARAAYTAMVDFVKSIMRENTDFGVVPGTTKPTLLKPGAEKLCRFFGLSARFDMTKEVEDWYAEEPFFSYRYKCSLYSLATGALVGEGEGSCNSHEKKYRYRTAARVCPECGKDAIIKGKKEYGGGWVCFTKKGGCGAKFPDGHFTGEAQQEINPDMADLPNTLQKMAQKRAFIAATLIAVNASEFFTQDVEDLHYGAVDAEYVVTDARPDATRAAQVPPSGAQGQGAVSSPKEWPARPWGLSTTKAFLEFTYDNRTAEDKSKPMTTEEHKKLGQLVSGLFPDKATRKVFQYLMFGADNYSIDGMSVATGKTYRAWARDAKNAKLEAESIIATQEFAETAAAIANAQTELG